MTRSQLLHYGVATLAVAQVLLIKLLAPQIGKETPFLLFFTAVMVSAGYGGTVAGLLATVLVALVSNYFFLSPVYSFSLDWDELLKIGVFILEGLLITSVIVALNVARQRAEENALKVERQQESLRKTEERYRLLVEGVKDHAIFMLDPDGRIVNWNAGAERIYGYQTDEVVGRLFSIFYPKEDQAPGHELKIACQEGYFEATGQRLRKDGTRFWADIIITALRDQAGNLQGFSKVAHDITERQQLESELHQRAEKLEQVNRVKDEFLATLSHELRTPLNSVLGWAQLLRTRKLNEAKIACGLETIERNAKSQVQLIEDLLDVSSMIKGKLRLNIFRVDLVALIEAAIATMRPAANAKALSLIFSVANCVGPDQAQETVDVKSNQQLNDPNATQNLGFTVTGDPDRIHQIVWNLLSNAVKFTPKGGQVNVQLSVVGNQDFELNPASTTQTSFAQIQVSDTGQGINRDLLPYVFNRFYQADSTSTRLHNGLGLGLAITRHLVELHGGTIQASSQGDAQGARFTVNLPLSASSSKDEVMERNSSYSSMANH